MTLVYVGIGLILILLVGGIFAFNALRKAQQGVNKDFNNITTELERRYGLIPNLVEAVKQYAAHERGTLNEIVEARSHAQNVPSDPQHATELASAQDVLGGTLGKLFALAENYPDLKANQNFLQLQGELTDTEDRIAASRKLYNSSVEHLNNLTTTFPTNMFTGIASVNTAEYYTVSATRQQAISEDVNLKNMF